MLAPRVGPAPRLAALGPPPAARRRRPQVSTVPRAFVPREEDGEPRSATPAPRPPPAPAPAPPALDALKKASIPVTAVSASGFRRRLRAAAFAVLPLSIFRRYDNLPRDGKTRTTAEESCDPLERNCQTPIFTWEARCAACGGSGAARSAAVLRAGRGRGRGRGTPAASYATCVTCSGVGYVRHTSARVIPDLGARAPGAAAPAATTLGRPPPGPDESYDEEYWSEGEEGDG